MALRNLGIPSNNSELRNRGTPNRNPGTTVADVDFVFPVSVVPECFGW
jgi:hypothetical protein